MAGKKTWASPENALRMRGLIADIAKDAVESAIQYRKAIVDVINAESLEVHFPEEAESFLLENLPPERPAAAGQTVEVLIRDQVNFSLYKVYGATVIVGTATPDQFAPTAAPSGVTVTMGSDGTATVTWDALGAATSYDVQWATDSGFTTGVQNGTSTSNQYLISNLPTGTGFHVRVRGRNIGGPGPYGPGVTAATPAAVGGISLSSSNRSITATWTPQAGVVEYEVQRSKSATFASGNVSTIVTSNHLTINNLLEDEVWYFRIRAVSSSGTGAWSTVSSIAVQTDTPSPDAPTGTTALLLTAQLKQITATWDPIDGADQYELQRSNSSVFTTGPVIEFIEGTQFIALELNAAQEYWFRVRAVNSAGNGPWSATVSKTVPLASEISDGTAPANSPTVTVEPSLKMLTAKWPAQANGDLVTYEVHMSTTTNFTPAAATKLGETTNTFWVTTKDAAGTALVIGTTYFMRVVAKDRDGAAVPGGQGSGVPLGINLGEAGDVPAGMVTGDGVVPGKPAAPAIISGIGYLYASWTRPTSNDPIERYEVHVSTNSAFVPDANTLSLVTGSLFGFIRKQGPGQANAALVYGTTYYIKLIAIDVDGVSVPSDAASGFTIRTGTADIVAGAVTASILYSGAVMADRIQATNIATDAVTARTIYSGAIMSERIQTNNLATNIITAASAIIADAAITNAKIDNLAVNNAKINDLAASKITTEVLYATLTVSGIIRTSTSSTRVEMNSGGIYAYSGGTTTFELNASNGNAYFRGNIYAVNGTFTGFISSSAEISGGTLTGALIRSASSGARVSLGTFSYSASEMGTTYSFGPYPALSFHDAGNIVRNLIYSDGGQIILERTGGAVVYIQSSRVYIASQLDVSSSLYATGVYDQSNRVYSAINPPPAHSHDYASSGHSHSIGYIGNAWLSDAPLIIRSSGDANHVLRYGIAGRDGPDLRGFHHVGLLCMAYSSTAAVFRVEGSGNALLGGALSQNQSIAASKREARPLAGSSAKGSNVKKRVQVDPKEKYKDKVKRLKPLRFQRNDIPPEHPNYDDEHMGFTAEEMQYVFPEVVGYDDDDKPQGISYGHLTVPLVQAMQELMEEIDELRSQVNAMKKPA